jgi:hypothetical protein
MALKKKVTKKTSTKAAKRVVEAEIDGWVPSQVNKMRRLMKTQKEKKPLPEFKVESHPFTADQVRAAAKSDENFRYVIEPDVAAAVEAVLTVGKVPEEGPLRIFVSCDQKVSFALWPK